MNAEDVTKWFDLERTAKARIEDLEAKLKKAKQIRDQALEQLQHIFPYSPDAPVSYRHPQGTFMYNVNRQVRVVDQDAFLEWLIENDAWGYLTKAVRKEAVLEALDEYETMVERLTILEREPPTNTVAKEEAESIKKKLHTRTPLPAGVDMVTVVKPTVRSPRN